VDLQYSFSSAVHPFFRLTDSQGALCFGSEEARIALPGTAKQSRSYPGVNSAGTYRNRDRLYSRKHRVSALNNFMHSSAVRFRHDQDKK